MELLKHLLVLILSRTIAEFMFQRGCVWLHGQWRTKKVNATKTIWQFFCCSRNATCYNCAPQPNQAIQLTPGRRCPCTWHGLVSRFGKMRRRFDAGFMSGVDGLNVPAPALFESSSKEVLRNGNPAIDRIRIWATAICNRQICKSSKRASDSRARIQ